MGSQAIRIMVVADLVEVVVADLVGVKWHAIATICVSLIARMKGKVTFIELYCMPSTVVMNFVSICP